MFFLHITVKQTQQGQEMGGDWSVSSAVSGRKTVGDDLQRETKGNHGAVDSIATDI